MAGEDQKPKGVGILPHMLFLFSCVAAVVWMEMATQLPLWAAVLIVSPQTAMVIYALLTDKQGADETARKPRKYEIGVGVICAVVSLMAGIRAASYFFLVYLYGLTRVRNEHLRFVAMPKGHPWIVSNGDRISEGHFLHYLIGIGVWMALFPWVYWLVYRLLPLQEEPSPSLSHGDAIR